METHALQIRCCCGTTIMSDNILGSMVYCHACDSYNIITNSKLFASAVTYKITRFEGNARNFRKVLFNYFYEHGDKALFSEMTSFSLERYYVPVREVGSGDKRFFVQLNETDSYLSATLFPTSPVINYSLVKNALPDSKTKDLNLTDHQPLYAQREAEKVRFLPIDISMSKIDSLYDLSGESAIVRYLPVFILKTNLVDIVCIGTVESDDDDNFVILNKDEVDKIIGDKKIPPLAIRVKTWLKDNILDLVGVAFVISVVYGVYKLFTIGITARFLFELMLTMFGALFGVFATAFMMGIFILALRIIFRPATTLIVSLRDVLRGDRYNRPNYKKGLTLMGLNK